MNQLSSVTTVTTVTTKMYENETLGVRLTVYKDQSGEFWFVGKEVAGGLGYADSRKAIARHVHEDDKCGLADVEGRDVLSLPCNWGRDVLSLPCNWGRDICRGPVLGPLGSYQPHKKLINESGLYTLVLGSHMPKALGFKRWVTKEVLPSIRRSGYYAVPEVLVAIKGIEPDDVSELRGPERREFRRESKFRSDLAKNHNRVSRGARGGKALWMKIRHTKSEYEDAKVRISELEDENKGLKAENEDLKDENEDLGFDNVCLGYENKVLKKTLRTKTT